MKVVILAAGRGQRFMDEGIQDPKVLLEVHGKPVIFHNLFAFNDNGVRPIVVAAPRVAWSLRKSGLSADIVEVPIVQPSPVHSLLLASAYIDPHEQVLVFDGDQIYVPSIVPVLLEPLPAAFRSRVVCAEMGKNPSYCSVYHEPITRKVSLKEKDGGSPLVVTGGYGFSSWCEFQESAFGWLRDTSAHREAKLSDIVNLVGKTEARRILPDDWISVGTPDELRALKV